MGVLKLYNMEDLRRFVKEMSGRRRKGKDDLGVRGEWVMEHYRGGQLIGTVGGKNIIPTEGLNFNNDVVLGATSKAAAWYVGIFKNNYTPISTNTAATALGAAGLFGECQDADYDPATNRPVFTPAASAAGVITNAASKAEFQMKASITVYGAFLASSQAKTATTGTLFAAKKFDSSRAVISGDILYVTYQVTATSS